MTKSFQVDVRLAASVKALGELDEVSGAQKVAKVPCVQRGIDWKDDELGGK